MCKTKKVKEAEKFAPKQKRFLGKIRKYHYNRPVLYQWVECFWNGKEFAIWQGHKNISTTEPCHLVDWKEL